MVLVQLTSWAWAASRAIDYLYTLPEINKDQIGLAGFSRNGKWPYGQQPMMSELKLWYL